MTAPCSPVISCHNFVPVRRFFGLPLVACRVSRILHSLRRHAQRGVGHASCVLKQGALRTKGSTIITLAAFTTSFLGNIDVRSPLTTLEPSNAFAAPPGLTTGKIAPRFALPGIDGKTYRLDDFKGQVVVLEWFNSGCPFVVKHYQSGNMQALQKEFVSARTPSENEPKIAWLTIVSSAPGKQGHMSAEEHQEVAQKWGIKSSAFLIDATGEVGRLYGARTTPHMFIVDTDGKLIYQGAIDSTPSTKASDIPSSKNYVREALNELLAGKRVTEATTEPYGCSVKYGS